MIGSKKHPVSIVPDYLLYSDGRPAVVLDAKRPDADLVKSKHAEQAYSYAIHPDVRVRFYALCNGRQLVVYDIYGLAPIFEISLADIGRDWNIIESVLSPKNVSVAVQQSFAPDFGTAAVKMGFPSGCRWLFPFAKLFQFACIDDGLYTTSVGISVSDVDHLASFDADKKIFEKLLTLTDDENRRHLLSHLVPGQMVFCKRPIFASLVTTIGVPTQGQYETFVPLVLVDGQPLSEEQFQIATAMFDAT